MRKYWYVSLLLLVMASLQTNAQSADTPTYTTRTWSSQIKTLRMQYLSEVGQAAGSTPSRPYLTLGTNGEIDGTDANNTLEISWDEMSHDIHQYTYTLIHLNADGQPSDLRSYEYIAGFTTMDVSNYETSLNTSRDYTHYSLQIPNEDMRIKASGRYALIVYEDGRSEDVRLQVCFDVVEPMVDLAVDITPNTDIEISGRYQQLNIVLKPYTNSGLITTNIAHDYFLEIRQNGRLDNRVMKPQPSYVEGNRLRWQNNKELIWEAGNEYRHLDIYSTYYAGYHVDRVRYELGDYHAYLEPDLVKQGEYMHEDDNNGVFLVNAERTTDADWEAEYMWVHWTLMMDTPRFDGLFYVSGEAWQNRMDESNRMQYDEEHHCYYLNALLKQGGTDYQFFFVPKGQNKATLQYSEGSHWQAGNTYTVYTFYRPFGSRADRLIGISNYTSSSM